MKKSANYHYYVEGQDEKSLLEVLKRDIKCIRSGKIETFNVIQEKISIARIRPLKQGTVVVLIYDTDVQTNLKILQYNVSFLKAQRGIKDVVCIPQVKNLEDQLLYACKIRNIEELTKSITKTEYKKDLIRCSNLEERLHQCQFDIVEFWNRIPEGVFSQFGNDAEKVKICKRS